MSRHTYAVLCSDQPLHTIGRVKFMFYSSLSSLISPPPPLSLPSSTPHLLDSPQASPGARWAAKSFCRFSGKSTSPCRPALVFTMASHFKQCALSFIHWGIDLYPPQFSNLCTHKLDLDGKNIGKKRHDYHQNCQVGHANSQYVLMHMSNNEE